MSVCSHSKRSLLRMSLLSLVLTLWLDLRVLASRNRLLFRQADGKLAIIVFRIRSKSGLVQTNLAYGWPDRDFLYITESDTGHILRARLPTPGRLMFSHQP